MAPTALTQLSSKFGTMTPTTLAQLFYSCMTLLLCDFFMVFSFKITLLNLKSSTSHLLVYFPKNTNKTYKKLIKTY